MLKTVYRRFFVGLLLLLLISAHAGHSVHIFTEDLRIFTAFSGDLVPDNDADSGMSSRCLVCNYDFFSFLEDIQPNHDFYFELIAVLQPKTLHCECCDNGRLVSLRAPPMA